MELRDDPTEAVAVEFVSSVALESETESNRYKHKIDQNFRLQLVSHEPHARGALSH